MPDRRKSTRRSISYYLRVIDVEANQVIGHLADISLQGLKIDSQKPVLVNKEYRLRIYTTGDVSDIEFIEFLACTRWSELDPLDLGLYDIGFEIVEIDRHAAEIVQHIIDKYSAREASYHF